jgi:NADPH2:quinone reductase
VEVAGEVAVVSDDCGPVKTGDRVCTLLSGGGYAEYVVADAALCLPVPSGLDMLQAASLPEALFTVWFNVFDIGRLKPGENFLVHGGSSGIGTMAIQMAKVFGARVFTTAGNDRKCDFCRTLGADVAINYNSEDFVEACLVETNGKGMDVILDMVGGDYLPRNIKLASSQARIVMIAAIKGVKAEVNLLSIMQKSIVLTGSTLRSRPLDFKKAIADKLLTHVWPLLESGRIRPVIYRTFPLSEAGSAHRLMESNEHMSKILLEII